MPVLHSWLTPHEWKPSLGLFRGVVPALVNTDVGAHGLDIHSVTLVVNWDLRGEQEGYTQHVGSTARAGKGRAAVFCDGAGHGEGVKDRGADQ